MSDNIEDELRALVSDIIEVPVGKLKPEADFIDDLQVDSLKAIEIVAAVEKKYRIVIPDVIRIIAVYVKSCIIYC